MKSVTQEQSMGCRIACVAFALNKSYPNTRKLFDNPEYSSSKGYYLRDLIKVLNRKSKEYLSGKVTDKNRNLLKKEGAIVFIKRCKRYPVGHYLIKTSKGWMNPWINFPEIKPAKSGFERNLPGEPQWIIYER